jgi:hypothetical protein
VWPPRSLILANGQGKRPQNQVQNAEVVCAANVQAALEAPVLHLILYICLFILMITGPRRYLRHMVMQMVALEGKCFLQDYLE